VLGARREEGEAGMSTPAPVQQYLAMDGAELRRDLSQFFTPAWLAERVWTWAWKSTQAHRMRVLEPSAGRGALIRATLNDPATSRPAYVCAFDVDPSNIAALEELRQSPAAAGCRFDVRFESFIAADIDERFDLALMNPPFEDNQDVAFIEAASAHADRAVSICPARIEFSEGRSDFWRWHDITRKVVLEKRPRFGGHTTGQTDFIVLEMVRRAAARKQGEANAMHVERW
jgi:predicted RNA methylase